MAFVGIVATGEVTLVAGHRVLVRLDTAVAGAAVGAEDNIVVKLEEAIAFIFPAEREVRSGHDLDEVHEIEAGFVGVLAGVVKRVHAMVGPRQERLLQAASDRVGEMGPEAKVMDDVSEVMGNFRVPVVLEVVHVHIAVAEAAPRGEVEVSDDLVDTQAAFDSASLVALLVETTRIVFQYTLLDIFSASETPLCLGIRLTHLVTRVAATWLRGVGRGRGTIAGTAIVGVEMRSLIFLVFPF